MIFYEEQEAKNNEHIKNPQPGDYWHDMFCPIAIVLAVTEESVTFCEKTKEIDHDYWTWDLSIIKKVWKEDFGKNFYYDSEKMKDKTWCDVGSKTHIDVVEWWLEEK